MFLTRQAQLSVEAYTFAAVSNVTAPSELDKQGPI